MSIASPPDPGGWDLPAFAPAPFGAFRDELLALYAPPMRAKKTRAKLRQALDLIAGLLGPDATTADLTPALVGRLIGSRPAGESPYTTAGFLANLRTACSYARSRGYLRNSPFEFRKKWIRVGRPARKRHHSREDIAKVLALLAAEVGDRSGWARWRARRLQALAAAVAYTGMRRDEALNLHVEDVDLDGRMLLIVERSGHRLKTERSAQPVPIPEGLAPILAAWMRHRMDEPEAGFPSPPSCPSLFPNVTRTNAWKDGPVGYRPLDQLRGAGEPGSGPAWEVSPSSRCGTASPPTPSTGD